MSSQQFNFAHFWIILLKVFTISHSTILLKDLCYDTTATTLYTLPTGPRSTTTDLIFQDPLSKIPRDWAIGVSGFGFVSSKVDFELAVISASSTQATVEMKANDQTQSKSFCFSVLLFVTPNIHAFSYDFGTNPGFSGLSTTNVDKSFEFVIPYSPAYPNLYDSDAEAFLMINALKFDDTSTIFHIDHQIISVSSNQVRIKLNKYGDCRLLRLRAHIVVVSKSAYSENGFALKRITSNPVPAPEKPAGGASFEGIIDYRDDYTSRPIHSAFLSMFKISPIVPGVNIDQTLGMSGDFLKMRLHYTMNGGSGINALGYDVIFFCSLDNNCLLSQPNDIQSSMLDLTFTGTLIESLDASVRTKTIYSVYDTFFPTQPKYFAVGIRNIDAASGVSVKVTDFTKNSYTVECTAQSGGRLTRLGLSYLASNWDGLQAYYVDFLALPSMNPVTTGSYRSFDVFINYFATPEIGINAAAFVTFTEFEIFSGATYLDYEVVATTTSSLRLRIYTSTTAASNLKGYVIVYRANTDKYKMEYKYYPIDQLLWLTAGSYRVQTGTLSYIERYIETPNLFFAFHHMRAMSNSILFSAEQQGSTIDSANCKHSIDVKASIFAAALTEAEFSLLLFEPSFSGKYFSDNFSYRFTGIIDNMITQTLCLKGPFKDSLNYALMVTADSYYSNFLYFGSSQRYTAKFITILPIQSIEPTIYAKIDIPQFSVKEDTVISYNVANLRESEEIWNFAGFDEEYINAFPNSKPTKTFAGTFTSDEFLSTSWSEYKSMAASRIYSHDLNIDFYCNIIMTFSGIIRGIYVNNDYVFGGSSLTPNETITIESGILAPFLKNELAHVVIVGYRFVINSFDFANCVDGSSNDVSPVLIGNYISPKQYISSIDFEYPSDGSICATGCINCQDIHHCFECEPNKYLFQGSCVQLCPDLQQLVPVRGKYCDHTQSSFAIRQKLAQYSKMTNRVSIDYKIDPFREVNTFLVKYYPYTAKYGNYPGVFNDSNETKSVSRATYYLHHNSDPELDAFTLKSTDKIVKKISPKKLPIQIIAYSVVKDSFLYAKVTTSNQNRATEVQYLNTIDDTVLEPSIETIIQTLIDCDTICNVEIEYKGTLKVVLNEMSFLEQKSVNRTTIILDKEITGINDLKFSLRNCDKLTINITGKYVIYAPKDFLFEDQFDYSEEITPSCSYDACAESEEDAALLKDIRDSVKGLCILGVVGAGLMFLYSNPGFTWMIIGILQKYYYLIFINVLYPYNLQQFLSVFSIGRLNFVFEIFPVEGHTLAAPEKFENNGMDGLFFLNAGSILTIWLALFLIYLLLCIILRYSTMLRLPPKVFENLRKKKKAVTWSGVMRTWMVTYAELSLAGFLQLSHLSYDSFVEGLATTISFPILILNILFPIIGFAVIFSLRTSDATSKEFHRFLSLYDDLKDRPKPAKYYNMVLITRRLFTCFALVILHDFPYAELFFMLGVDFLHLLYLIIFRPYENRNEQVFSIVDELIYFTILILITRLQFMNDDENAEDQSRYTIGWAVIGLCLSGMIVVVTFVISYNYSIFKEWHLKYRRYRRAQERAKAGKITRIYRVKCQRDKPLVRDEVKMEKVKKIEQARKVAEQIEALRKVSRLQQEEGLEPVSKLRRVG